MKTILRIRDLQMIVIAVALIGLTAAVAVEAFAQDTDEVKEAYRHAKSLLRDGEYDEAARLYGEFANQYSESSMAARALYWRAFALYREGSKTSLLQAKVALEQQLERYREEALDGDSAELAVRIRGVLAERGDARAAAEIAKLAEELESSSDRGHSREDETRMVALNALLQMRPERALPILKKILVDKPGEVSTETRDQAIFLVSQHAEQDEALEILLHVVRNDQSSEVREQAVFWLGQTENPRALDILDSLVSNPDESDAVREKAVFAISQTGGERAAQILRDLAVDKSADVGVREQAIFWLSQGGSRNAGEFLIELYPQVDEPELKEKVIFAVSQLGGRESEEFLMEVVRDQSEETELRKNAMFWIGQIDGVDEDSLLSLMEELDSTELQEQAVFALSQIGSKKAIQAMIEIARSSKDPEIREQAVFWLGQSNSDAAADYLEELVQEDW